MAAVEEYLVRRDDGLVLLFTPPFDQTPLDPGYIKGYPPGIRENGGQYTHGAIWSVIAFAMLGDGDKAGELFSLLNPINHASTRAAIYRYKVEPYVACGRRLRRPAACRARRLDLVHRLGRMDVSGRPRMDPRISSARARRCSSIPCIPKTWRHFEIVFRYHSTRYDVAVENPHGVSRGVTSVELDGEVLPRNQGGIPLVDDGATHRVRVSLG